MRKSVIVKISGLIFSAIFIKISGFVFRIYLSKVAGEEGCGLYHLVLSVYAFGASISAFGMNQALSRLVSYNEKYSKRILRTALVFTGVVSFFVSVVIFIKSEYIAVNFLKDLRTVRSLKAISICFPMIAVFSSVSGYFNGLSKVNYTPKGQIVEQITRILFVFLFTKKAMEQGLEHGIFSLSVGIVLGECVSSLYMFFSYRIFSENKKDAFAKKYFLRDILKVSIPIASGGFISSFIHTLESILLPLKLTKSGLTNFESVSILGAIKGMAIPIVFLPTIVISSMSVLILPKISKEDSGGNSEKIKNITKNTLSLSFLTGFISIVFFFAFGDRLTTLIYGNSRSSYYVKPLSLGLPFLFFNILSSSVLNGLGMQNFTLIINVLTGTLKLLSVVFFVPLFGVKGYFAGFVVSELIGFIMYFSLIYNKVFIKNAQNTKKC